MRSRIRRIFAKTEEAVDLIVFSNSTSPHVDVSFLYATGLTDGVFEGCAAFCTPDGRAEIVTSVLEEGLAQKAGLPTHAFRSREEREGMFRKQLRGHRRIGINASEITERAATELRRLAPKRATFVDVSRAVTEARLIKDDAEVRTIRKASRIASRAFEEVLPKIDVGRRESEVAADLVYAMQLQGASGASFRTIVGSGPNSADPHYTAGPRKLRKGDLVVIDFGARYRLYCSDVTRTVSIGWPTKKQREIYETVAEAQATALKKMRSGVKAKTCDTVARDVIDSTEYHGRFIHSLGHSLGLEVHDGGGMSQASTITLRKNMVMTNEPGIYIPGYGGVRIEDDVLITSGAPRVLSDAPRELIAL